MTTSLYGRIQAIIASARAGAARSVNTAQVVSNWMIGREVVEEEQKGEMKAEAELKAEIKWGLLSLRREDIS